MRNIIKTFALAGAFVIFSCGSGGGGGSEETGNPPVAAILSAPANNSECLSGTSVSETESKVTFQWNPSANADSYILYVKNLTTQTTLQYVAGAVTNFDVTLLKGTPYSWYIVSKSKSATATATSEKWKFYNSGTGTVNYVPFPAEAVSPPMSSTISGPTVNFAWTGSDVDNDIVSYDLYMDTTTNPTTKVGTATSAHLDAISVSGAATYYWKVVTKDGAGNTSDSPVFQFKTY
ncbi:hypothetical protein [Flavobacterium sp. 3HN19-14]|uniref:hypothetical protein n=1 Tax=Flavobacterium sp. 3HN19-14 TaxID=3448133 RepID=UPI003EE181FE